MAKSKENGPRCTWSDNNDTTLVRMLRECKEKGMQSDNGWKPQVWHVSAEALKGGPGGIKTVRKTADHWTNLKSAFCTMRKLREQSGFGWDEGLKLVTASNDVWEAHITSHPKARKWRNTSFPLYDDILYLVDGIIATGAGAFHAGTTQSQSQPSDDSQGPSQGDDDDNDAGTGDLSTDTLVNDDLTLSSLVVAQTPHPGRKRAASSSPLGSPCKRHKHNAEAASDVSMALRDVALLLNIQPQGIPEVRRQAIRMMEEDGEFSDEEEVDIMCLFSKDTALAQTYIGSSKKTTRTAFIRSVLRDIEL
ncbi:hypothetical protein C8J57DRAFT_1535928 [Mycena rebaudengoi]|nr:hypothetical protein C8J57DRAFT_1535928 [Mycena rebaudengoi]